MYLLALFFLLVTNLPCVCSHDFFSGLGNNFHAFLRYPFGGRYNRAYQTSRESYYPSASTGYGFSSCSPLFLELLQVL